MADKNETDLMRAQQKSIEQLDAEHANDAPGGALPVTWSSGGRKMRGRPLMVLPDEHDVEVFGRTRVNTCGQCKNYDLEGGRREIIKQRFAERLVREEQWKLHHLGDVDSLAICKQRPSMAISYISPSCDLFKLRTSRR